jgi:RNA polymerase sigma-70 factor (ECF subfamily)
MTPDSQPESNPSHPADTPTDTAIGDTLSAERRLVAAVLRKDRKAAAELVATHVDAVYGYLRHRLAPRLESVEDLVHDVFLAALANLQRFRGASPLRAWLLGIARHKVEDFYRAQLHEPEPLVETGDSAEPADEILPVEERIDTVRAAEKTQRILRTLPKPYSVVLLWRYWENRSIREIAEASGTTEKAIERLLARARASFRKQWERVE